MLLLLNKHGNPSFLFQNLGYYDINNQEAKFHKHISACSVSVEHDLNCFVVFQVYCEYRALLAEDATSSRQKNVRYFALHDLPRAKFMHNTCKAIGLSIYTVIRNNNPLPYHCTILFFCGNCAYPGDIHCNYFVNNYGLLTNREVSFGY